jgi:hypothetical protein
MIDFVGVTTLTVKMTLADSVPSVVSIYGIYVYQKSAATSKSGYFADGDRIALLGDSWTQYPLGTGIPRADGTTTNGQALLGVRLSERLLQDGISVTTLNMGQGGRTTAWGLHWINSIITLTPKPTHCIILFWLNDLASAGTAESTADTQFDFDPDNQWVPKVQSLGGKKGSVTNDQWYSNLQEMSSRLLRSGIKPIIIMPGHSASVARVQTTQRKYLAKIAPGFNDINAQGGGE